MVRGEQGGLCGLWLLAHLGRALGVVLGGWCSERPSGHPVRAADKWAMGAGCLHSCRRGQEPVGLLVYRSAAAWMLLLLLLALLWPPSESLTHPSGALAPSVWPPNLHDPWLLVPACRRAAHRCGAPQAACGGRDGPRRPWLDLCREPAGLPRGVHR